MSTPSESLSPFERETYTLSKRWHIAAACEALAGAMHARMDGNVDLKVRDALRYIYTFLGKAKPLPELSETEATFSSNVHTYMRKCWDTSLATMLYRFIADSKGAGVWYAFCQGAVVSKYDLSEALEMADAYYHDHDEDPDNLYMLCALKMWTQADFKRMLTYLDLWPPSPPTNPPTPCASKSPMARASSLSS